ncbi:MAG: type II secretion system secretin GspD [Pseudomonadota bacterium]|nr:type II secretion system secretin GspD [Pseudomonadota bacterium]
MTNAQTTRTFPLLLAGLAAGLLAACATVPPPNVQRRADPLVVAPPAAGDTGSSIADPAATGPQPVIRRGSGQVIDRAAAAAPPRDLPNLSSATTGAATFNFEGAPVQVVVKAILGEMLGQNYVIQPGVQGTVTLATPKPVSPAAARDLLEMVLGWNNARLVYSGGRYNVIAADQPLAGAVAPRSGPASTARGFETRVVPLRYISATEMAKALEPYARDKAIVSVDKGRNVITVAGSRTELENYLRTIEVFDVDWMSSMSVGVFPLQAGRASDVVEDLEKVFGQEGESPVAGMFRFLPLDAANAVLVITPQPDYLDSIQEWLERIDGAGGGLQLYSQELKYIKANELADRLAEVFGSAGGRGGGGRGDAASLMPGLTSTEIRDSGVDGGGTSSAPVGGSTEGTLSLDPREPGNGSVSFEVDGSEVGVSAVDETNTLLVRSSAQAWRSIQDVIARLDVMPLQVHIEAQVVEVKLSGDLKYGVNWFFEQAVDAPVAEGGAGLPSALGRSIWGDIAGSIGSGGASWTFLGRNAAAVINALDEVTDLRLLQTPSVLVRNNVEATLNVGTRIPIQSVSFNPGGVGDTGTVSQVQYLDTGVILKVRPRVTRDGVVFLDIVQEVSSPGAVPASCASNAANCNVPIDTRRLKTEAAIQSGDTVMLAGLISDSVSNGSSGVPGLSRIPLIGSLFGTRSTNSDRSEVIVLLTPSIVRNPQEARDLTDEYGRRFRAMEPLHTTP